MYSFPLVALHQEKTSLPLHCLLSFWCVLAGVIGKKKKAKKNRANMLKNFWHFYVFRKPENNIVCKQRTSTITKNRSIQNDSNSNLRIISPAILFRQSLRTGAPLLPVPKLSLSALWLHQPS